MRLLLLLTSVVAFGFLGESAAAAVPNLEPPSQQVLAWPLAARAGGVSTDPSGLAVDSTGSVHVVELGANRIQKFTADGVFITQWTVTAAGGAEGWPYAVAVDHRGDIYVSDIWGSGVLKFAGDGSPVSRWSQRRPKSFGPPHQIQKMSNESGLSSRVQSRNTPPTEFITPVGIAVDRSGDIFVLDRGLGTIQRFRY
jgi:hypothetical protein